MVLARVDPSILVALIGFPAAFILAVGTIYAVRRPVRPPPQQNGNGPRVATYRELREAMDEVRDDMGRMKTDLNARLDIVLRMLGNRGEQ